MRLRSKLWALSALVLLAPVLAEELRLAVSRGPVSLPIYVAESQGYFEREGVEVRMQECSLPSPRVYTQHFSLIASRQAIARREAELVKLLRALARAERFIAEQPAQAQHILKTRLPGGAGSENFSDNDFRLVLEQSLITTMDGQARWAKSQGLVPSGASPGNLLRSIAPSPLRKAVPGSVSLVQ